MTTELKTLNDISKNFNGWCRDGDLKAEAIKWVKFLESKNKDSDTSIWIRSFFNLTEEDLK